MTPEDIEQYAQVMVRYKILRLRVPVKSSINPSVMMEIELSPEAFASNPQSSIDSPESQTTSQPVDDHSETLFWSSPAGPPSKEETD